MEQDSQDAHSRMREDHKGLPSPRPHTLLYNMWVTLTGSTCQDGMKQYMQKGHRSHKSWEKCLLFEEECFQPYDPKFNINSLLGQESNEGQKLIFAVCLPCVTYCVSLPPQGLLLIFTAQGQGTELGDDGARLRLHLCLSGAFSSRDSMCKPGGWPLKFLQFQQCTESQWLLCWVRIIGWPREKPISEENELLGFL